MTSKHSFLSIFKVQSPVIAMIHLHPLPGTPNNTLSPKQIIKLAIKDAKTARDAGADALLLENMGDRPYLKRNVGPEIVASMTACATQIRQAFQGPIGLQILAGANHQALAVAHAANLQFIRAEAYLFAHTADEGHMDADAGSLRRYQKQLDAQNILILTDIQKKHSSHAITQDLTLLDWAHAAEFMLSDGLIITGSSTGQPANPKQLAKLKLHTQLPLLVGSGMTPQNLEAFFPHTDAFIIGSFIKEQGLWQNPIDPKRLLHFIKETQKLRDP